MLAATLYVLCDDERKERNNRLGVKGDRKLQSMSGFRIRAVIHVIAPPVGSATLRLDTLSSTTSASRNV